ncbi:GNAT family N-acetyltransferase [Mycobacterium sp. KBS0706]|uniref:GNAT family N-acetyltransferase n=1 Tax=Mycobacterium sp. KBS0706 TaxID=2578109 RepID=UPI00110FDF18|nr:GNAT family N-acetyltransferase [Mycobacterium sp. KBS0706]TSD87436.1 GNAT family N-acetyltransferase [Mycobacterium sp. KBS0706]
MTPICRRMRPEEAEALVVLMAAAFGNPRFGPTIARLSRMPNAAIHVLEADGALRAGAAMVDYGRVAYLGVVGTDPAMQGRGFGRRIVETALAPVPADRIILLDASPSGAPLYETLGFVDVDASVVLEAKGPVEAPPVPGLAPMAEADLPAVAAYDAAVFGADRTTGLTALFREHPAGMVCRHDGRVAGYGLRHPDRIGPVLAEDQDTAAALVAALSVLGPAGPMTITVPSSHAAMLDHLHRSGVPELRRLRHMRRGGDRHPSDRGRIAAMASFHLG